MRFTPSRKVLWDPRGPVPEIGPDDSVVVPAVKLEQVQQSFQWLVQGQHPFRSVVIDSLTEVQKRMLDSISGTEQPKLQDFGSLKRRTESMVRQFRDLTMNPTRPVEVVVFVCGTQEKGQDHPVMRPMLVGSMSETLAYFVDVQGFLTLSVGAEGALERRLLVAQLDGVAAKDRTGRLGVAMDGPTIPRMLNAIYGPEGE